MKLYLYILLFGLGFQMPLQSQFSGLSFSQLDSLQLEEARPVIVFLHADWCRYCEGMKKNVFSDVQVKKRLAEGFYFLDFNGESQRPVTFREHVFKFKPNGKGQGVHELAEALGSIDGVLSYPSIVVLDPKLEVIYQNASFINKKQFLKLLDVLNDYEVNKK